jgi:predicted AAA+ superfamily ATPase
MQLQCESAERRVVYLNRTLESFWMGISGKYPVLLLTGPRQSGKTTLLKHLKSKDRAYVTLDSIAERELARRDPALFLQRFGSPVIIDEIQYAPDLLSEIKVIVDRNRSEKEISFWLTGSQKFHLMKGVSESLAGRVGIVNILGLSQRELMHKSSDDIPFLPETSILEERMKEQPCMGLMDLYKRIWKGSLPGLVLYPDREMEFYLDSYMTTYILRDIRDLSRIGDEIAFMRFVKAAAARTGQLLNMSDLAKDADVSHGTARNWISILETTGIVYMLSPYHSNITKRIIKTPKLYFLDTGLCSHLTGWSSPKTLEAGAMTGHILETWVISEIIKSYIHAGKIPPIFFYRDRDGKEIDLLIEKDGILYPVEIKKTASPGEKDIRNFRVLKNIGRKIGNGAVICLAENHLPLSNNITAYPVTAL